MPLEQKQRQPWRPNGDANSSSTTSLHQTVVGNIEIRRMDEFIPAGASSDLQIQTRSRGKPTEVPSQHFTRGVLGKNRCHGRRHWATRRGGREELPMPPTTYHCCVGGRAGPSRRGDVGLMLMLVNYRPQRRSSSFSQ